MTTLRQALQQKPSHFIAIIGRESGLGIDSNLGKPDLVNKVALALSQQANLSASLFRLTSEEEQALLDLLTAGGRLPARHLVPQYGPLRTTRRIIQAYREQAGLSPLEKLCLLGLVFHDPQTTDLFIPADLIPHLPASTKPLTAEASSAASLSSIDRVCYDLTCLLALLQRDDVSLLHRRWLPPHFLTAWAQLCAVSPNTPGTRSELQTGRRRFLHYLAESAGFVPDPLPSATDHRNRKHISNDKARTISLKPTPAAWLWIKAGRNQRLQTLWQAWLTPDLKRWQRFRLPGADWLGNPARLLDPIHQAMLEIDLSNPVVFADALLRQQPNLNDLIPANIVDPKAVLLDTIVELVTGPLVWLGILSDRQEAATSAGGSESSVSTTSPHPHSQAHLQITVQGRALLSDHPLADDDPLPPAKFTIKSDIQSDLLESILTLTLNNSLLPEPADLMVALDVGLVEVNSELKHSKQRQDNFQRLAPYALHITAISFIQALYRGWSPPALLDALNQLAERPLTGEETGLLRSWAEAANRMIIRPASILEVTDPEIITRLASTRRGRSLIHRTLSSRAIVIDPARIKPLVRRLTQQEGVPPRTVASISSELENKSQTQTLNPNWSAHLWLALRVYQDLGHYFRLPARTPQALVDQLAKLARPTDLASAEVAAEQTLAALQQALDGQTPFAPWPEDNLSVEQSLAVIEEALTTGNNVRLLYYAAGTDRLTRRLVEPYRIQWHGGTGAVEQGSRGARENDTEGVEGQGSGGEDENDIEGAEGQGSGGVDENDTEGAEEQGSGGAEENDDEASISATRRQSATPYLIGFCHLTQAERMFRLDRIQDIAMETDSENR